MNRENTSEKTFISKLYGGLNFNWMTVIIYAVAAAVITAAFLILPVFRNTSFQRMGVHMEAWIFLAIIVMSNTKKPLESALKTFVFFLISQPLIYLIQVPFNGEGWAIFRFYPYWFKWTLLTFPMAYVGWYIKKKNWLSLLILAPVLVYLGSVIFTAGRECFSNFPHLIVTLLFCILQVIAYALAFLSDIRQRIIAILIPTAVVCVLSFMSPQLDLQVTESLPGGAPFSENATVTVEDGSICKVQFHSEERGEVYIVAYKYGATEVIVNDGDIERHYYFLIYNEGGVAKVRISEVE